MFVDKKKRVEPEIPTGPMADVSFLLLIFFLVTTTLHTDKGLMMQLPAWGDLKPIPKQNISNLGINAAGDILFDGELVPLSAIKEMTRSKTAANPNLLISIKADNQTSYERFVAVLDQIQIGQFQAMKKTRISIAEPEQ